MSKVGQQLSSGALSGFATTICLQPFDFLKTRVQQGDGGPKAKGNSSVLRIVRDVAATNGVFGLWRGTNATLVRNIPGVALYMTSLTQVRDFMARSPYFSFFHRAKSSSSASSLPSLTSQGNLISGAASRVAVGFIRSQSIYCLEGQSNMYAYGSLSSSFVSLVRGGPSELFRGFVASSMRDAPYAGLFVVFYEGIKCELSYVGSYDSAAASSMIHSVSAASAGGIATLLTHPFDVIKTKIQVRPEDKYHGLWSTTKTIWQQRGLMGFLDGASLRLSRKVLSSAIGWAVYEGILRVQHRRSLPQKSED